MFQSAITWGKKKALVWVLDLGNKKADAGLLRFEGMKHLSNGALGKVKLP